MKFNQELLAIDLVSKRVVSKQNLRQAAKDIGISFAQLNRIESQKCVPGVDTFLRLCEWINVTPLRYFNLSS